MVATEVGVLSPEEISKVAKEEVNEDPERVEADINAIKEWLSKQPHLQGTRSGKWHFSPEKWCLPMKLVGNTVSSIK